MLKAINYGNIGYSDSIDSKIRKEIQKIENRLQNSKNPEFEVWLKNNNPRTSAGPVEFVCSISVKYLKKRIFVTKASLSFQESFHKAKKVLEKLISKKFDNK